MLSFSHYLSVKPCYLYILSAHTCCRIIIIVGVSVPTTILTFDFRLYTGLSEDPGMHGIPKFYLHI